MFERKTSIIIHTEEHKKSKSIMTVIQVELNFTNHMYNQKI